MSKKFVSREIIIGKLHLGGNNPVRIQSMTNTPTLDTIATTAQIIRLVEAGCEMVRITAANIREAQNLKNIKDALNQKGVEVPLIADIHFKPAAAEVAAKIVEKVRINPGNYVGSNHYGESYSEEEYRKELEITAKKLKPLLKICNACNTTIRIGINHGSLSDRILFRYGNTPGGMVASAMEFIDICHQANFHNLIISLKSSHVPTMIKANQLMVKSMQAAGYDYPLHLGVTEAGNGEEARIKSAAGIGSLLAEGIGDTIRVSLTEAPENEISVAQKIVALYGRKYKQIEKPEIRFYIGKNLKNLPYPIVITDDKITNSDDTPLGLSLKNDNSPLDVENKIIKLSYPGITWDKLLLRAATDFSLLVQNKKPGGIWLKNKALTSQKQLATLSLQILQAMGLRYSKTEFIACPSCGRTLFDIEGELEKVKVRLGNLKGIKIAVMGCIVNGPGEMAGANYGFVGTGLGKVTLYKGSNPVIKNLSQWQAIEALVTIIKQGGNE